MDFLIGAELVLRTGKLNVPYGSPIYLFLVLLCVRPDVV